MDNLLAYVNFYFTGDFNTLYKLIKININNWVKYNHQQSPCISNLPWFNLKVELIKKLELTFADHQVFIWS